MAENTLGIFSNLGIDTRSEEDILAAREKARLVQQAEDLRKMPEDFSGQRALRRGGQQLGTALRGRFGQPASTLTVEEERTQEAMAIAQERIEELEASGAFTNKDLGLDRLRMAEEKQKIVAEELLRKGDMRGVPILQQLDQLRLQRQKDQLEREGLVERTAGAKQDRLQGIYDNKRKRMLDLRGESVPIWKQGETDQTKSVQAFIRDDGSAIAGNQLWELGSYTTVEPDPEAIGGGKVLVTPSDAGAIRKQASAVVSQIEGALQMKEAMQDSMAPDGSVNIMDGAGSLTTAAATALDLTSAFARSVESAWKDTGTKSNDVLTDGTGVGRDLTGAGAASAYVDSNYDELESIMGDLVPSNIRAGQRARAKFYSALVQMVYAKARSVEPGARQISDADFKNNMKGLAGSTSDPETFRQVMTGNIGRDVKGFDVALKMMPGNTRDAIISQEGLDEYAAAIARFDEAFAQPFGTAAEPGPGLTDAPPPEGETFEARKARVIREAREAAGVR